MSPKDYPSCEFIFKGNDAIKFSIPVPSSSPSSPSPSPSSSSSSLLSSSPLLLRLLRAGSFSSLLVLNFLHPPSFLFTSKYKKLNTKIHFKGEFFPSCSTERGKEAKRRKSFLGAFYFLLNLITFFSPKKFSLTHSRSHSLSLSLPRFLIFSFSVFLIHLLDLLLSRFFSV